MTNLDRDLADNDAAIQRLLSAVFHQRDPCPSGGAVNEASRPMGIERNVRRWAAEDLLVSMQVQTAAAAKAETEASTLRASLSPKIRAMLAW
jgi:hypothetical protein